LASGAMSPDDLVALIDARSEKIGGNMLVG
jgi:hypothetical protein